MAQGAFFQCPRPHRAGRFILSQPLFCVLAMALVTATHAGADSQWELHHQTENDTGCVLQSKPVRVYDGYQESMATLVSGPDALYVESKSVLDPTFGDIGMQIDRLGFIPMDGLEDRHRAIFTSHYEEIVAQFKAGREVHVQMRFWPTWPAQGLFFARFSLMGFTQAYEKLLRC